MWTRIDLKNKAKEALKRNYWKAVLVALLLMIVSGGFGSGFSGMSNHSQRVDKPDMNIAKDYEDLGNVFTGHGIGDALTQAGQEIKTSDWVGFIPFVILIVIVVVIIAVAVAILIDAFLINPLIVGMKRFFVQDLDRAAEIKEIAYAFDNHYWNIVVTAFFRNLFVFLWTLLLIVPGIIKAYEYRMIPYILGENPDMDRKDVFAYSKELMYGEKWNAFVLDLSFLGWHILGAITCGILDIFYVAPYQDHTNAALYETLKRKKAPVEMLAEESFS